SFAAPTTEARLEGGGLGLERVGRGSKGSFPVGCLSHRGTVLWRAVRTTGTATIACALLASLFSVGALAALTVTWTTAADFEGGTLYGLDASSSPGQLRLATVAPSPWAKHPLNPILGPGSGRAGDWGDSATVLYEGGVYKMWYQGCIGARCDIGYATSPDGLN